MLCSKATPSITSPVRKMQGTRHRTRSSKATASMCTAVQKHCTCSSLLCSRPSESMLCKKRRPEQSAASYVNFAEAYLSKQSGMYEWPQRQTQHTHNNDNNRPVNGYLGIFFCFCFPFFLYFSSSFLFFSTFFQGTSKHRQNFWDSSISRLF